MFVLVTGRRQGKTHAIVSWYLERPYERHILVADVHRKRHVVNMIGLRTRYMLDHRRVAENVIVVSGVVGTWGRSMYLRDIAIDDADYVLERLFGGPVEFLTMNATLIAQAAGAQDYVDGEEVPEWDDRPSIADVRRAIEK